MDEATKEQILEFIKKRTEKGKGLNNYKSIVKGCPNIDRKVVKKTVQALIAEGVLAYWSSGSSTYIRLPDYEPGDEGLTEGGKDEEQ